MLRRTASVALLALVACGGPSVDRPDGSIFDRQDGGLVTVDPPVLDPVRDMVRLGFVAVSGSASGARRVIAEGTGTNPVGETPGPDGSFCINLTFASEGTYSFSVYSISDQGEASERVGPFTVAFNGSVPDDPTHLTCLGERPIECGTVEICGDNKDNDCNGKIDENDPHCSPCQDDLFEENDDLNAPRIELGRHDDLQVCPSDADVFGIFAEAGQNIEAEIFFTHAEGNLDLDLVGLDRETRLSQSVTMTNGELVTTTATAGGEYKVIVYSSDADTANSYDLELRVTD